MKTKLPKAHSSSAQYQGKYIFPAFKLLGSSASLYENVFRALQKYGATVQDLKIEGLNTGGANVSYNLPSRNAIVRVRIDALEGTFLNLLAMNEEEPYQLVADCWNALNSADETIEPAEHGIVAAAEFSFSQDAYKKIVQPLVTIPTGLASTTESGVVFYLPGSEAEGDKGGAIILDRLRFNSGVLNLKFIMAIDAQKVPVPALKSYVDKHIEASLSALGLEVEK